MVKLSEILRKNALEDPTKEKNLISEALQREKKTPDLRESERIYEFIVQRLEHLFGEIKENKVIEGEGFISLAGMIIDGLMIESDLLQNMANKSHPYSNELNFLPIHSVNVGVIAANLGFAFDFDKAILSDLCVGALMHDIGMLIIPQDIINKPGKLTDKEYELIKLHPSYGLKYLRNIKNYPELAEEIISQHHEKISGKGYPEGKKGEEISKFAQIVGIAEIYEAISHSRPFRDQTKNLSEAVKVIIQEESSSFDKSVLRAFMSYITVYPVGSIVELNNQEIGVVQRVNRDFPLRPVVGILQDAKGKPLKDPKTIDLSASPILYIEKAIDDDSLTSWP